MYARAATTEQIGLVVALPAEARSMGARRVAAGACTRWQHGWVAVSGVGAHNALRAAERLLACGVTQLANWGVAGALDAGLAPGDVLIPDRVRYATDQCEGFTPDRDASAVVARQLAVGLPVHRGTLWSAARPVTDAVGKRALAARTGAIAVDMEAATIAAVAARARLPFVAVKAICDPLVREFPPRIVNALGRDGGVTPATISAVVFGGPAAWRAARLLAGDFAHARRTLATAARLAARPA